MGRRLTLSLTLEQTLMLRDIAQLRAVTAEGERRAHWQAIEREAAHAITLDTTRRRTA